MLLRSIMKYSKDGSTLPVVPFQIQYYKLSHNSRLFVTVPFSPRYLLLFFLHVVTVHNFTTNLCISPY